MNTASRAQSVADADQILVTQAVYQRVQSELAGSQAKQYRLKGFEASTDLYAALGSQAQEPQVPTSGGVKSPSGHFGSSRPPG